MCRFRHQTCHFLGTFIPLSDTTRDLNGTALIEATGIQCISGRAEVATSPKDFHILFARYRVVLEHFESVVSIKIFIHL